MHPRTISRISKKRTWLIEQDRKGVPKYIKRPLYARFPAIENVVIKFIRFARAERLPVTLRLIQERARKEAETRNILNFNASRGWVEKFLRRSPVQPSFRLRGKGDVTLPTDHAERMREIREITSQYCLKNIWNMDESGLFFLNGPRRSYLTNNENRSETRGAGLQTYKQRVSIVMAVNADGSHSFPVHFIGQSTNPICFLQQRFVYLKQFYYSEQNGWMDNNGFKKWIEIWYREVKERSDGPCLMILNNCGGHELDFSLPGVRFEFLPRVLQRNTSHLILV